MTKEQMINHPDVKQYLDESATGSKGTDKDDYRAMREDINTIPDAETESFESWIRATIENEVERWELEEFTNKTIDEVIDEVVFWMNRNESSIADALEFVNQEILDGNL